MFSCVLSSLLWFNFWTPPNCWFKVGAAHFLLIYYDSVSNLTCPRKAPGCFRTLTDRHGLPRIEKNALFSEKTFKNGRFPENTVDFLPDFLSLRKISGHTSKKWQKMIQSIQQYTQILWFCYYDSLRPNKKMRKQMWRKMIQYIQNGPFYWYTTILYNSVSNLTFACKAPGCFWTLTGRDGPPWNEKNRFFFRKRHLEMSVFRKIRWIFQQIFTACANLRPFIQKVTKIWPNTSKYCDSTTTIFYDPIQKMWQKMRQKKDPMHPKGPIFSLNPTILYNSVSNLTCAG